MESFGSVVFESGQVRPGCSWPVSFPVADFILAPVRLPCQHSQAPLRAEAGEVDREVSVTSLKEVQWREVRSQTGPQACALGPTHVSPLPATSLLPSCGSRFQWLYPTPTVKSAPSDIWVAPPYSHSPDQRVPICVVEAEAEKAKRLVQP